MTIDAYAGADGGARPLVKVPGLARVRRWRLLTQQELAQAAGVHFTTVWRLEHGHEANARTVRTLAKVLGVSPYELTEQDPERPPRADRPE